MLLALVAAAPATQPAPYQIPPAVVPAPPGAIPASQFGRGITKSEVTPNNALTKKLPELKFTQLPLADAIDHIRDVTGANIHVNWRSMELLNVTPQTQVSLSLRDVTARRALRALLDDTGAGEMLTFYSDEGVLEVTTKELADSKMITRVYPVEDLVTEIPNFAGPTFNLQSQSNTASGAGGGGSSGGSIFSGNSNEAAQDQATKAQRADSLVKLITETVRPEVWRENGGQSSVRYFNGHLIVTAPRSIHEAISGRS
jgi:hypothetical protein